MAGLFYHQTSKAFLFAHFEKIRIPRKRVDLIECLK